MVKKIQQKNYKKKNFQKQKFVQINLFFCKHVFLPEKKSFLKRQNMIKKFKDMTLSASVRTVS